MRLPLEKSIRTPNVEERVPDFALNLNALVDCGLGSICRARFLIFIDANVPDTIPAGIPGYSDFSIDAVPWMKEIRDGLVAIWQASEQASSESAVFVTNLAFYYGSNDEPSPTGMGSFFPSLKPQVPIVNEPMIQDLIYCLKFYAEVPRQI